VRSLVLLSLGADEVHGRDDRQEEDERDPLVLGDLRRPAHEHGAGHGQPDDRELEGRRSRAEATGGALGGLPYRSPDRAPGSLRPHSLLE
jgi:hypothetical protein